MQRLQTNHGGEISVVAGVVGERVRNASHAAISEDRGGARGAGAVGQVANGSQAALLPERAKERVGGATPMSAQAMAYRVAVEEHPLKGALSSEDEKPLNTSI